MKKLTFAALAAFSIGSAQAVVIFESADGSGLNPRFGIATTTTAGITNVTGDPNAGFADLYGPNASPFPAGVTPGGTITGSADVQFVGGTAQGASDARIFFRFYADADNSGGINFGEGSEFANRVEILGDFGEFDETLSTVQTILTTGQIPLVDQAGNTINLFEYGIALPQFNEQGNATSPNDVVGDYNVNVSNISFEATPEPTSTIMLGLAGILGLARRRR